MTTVNLSKPEDYYSQRNNRIRPHSACVPTSLIMKLEYDKIPFPRSSNQPEDDLVHFIDTDPRVRNFYANHAESWIRKEFASKKPANEIHPVMAYGISLWCGTPIEFVWDMYLQDFVDGLDRGESFVISGDFPFERSDGIEIEIGHAVCLVGYQKAFGRINNFIIDDPYGNYHTKYQSSKGDDILLPVADFNKLIKNRNKHHKWAYRRVL
jgi:hypothetical protein